MKNIKITLLAMGIAILASCKNNESTPDSKNFSEEQPPPGTSEGAENSSEHSGQNIGSHTDSTSVDEERPNPSNN